LKKNVATNYAKRLHAKYSLVMPVDLELIANKYANLLYMSIPFEIDGISANLKQPGVKPTIIVNNVRPDKRQRFTLAHEIGHVLIPWHMGTIFDITDDHSSEGTSYWNMEAEANAFATELLMPSLFVQDLIAGDKDIAKINEKLMHQADVSAIAAILRLRSELPPGYVFFVSSEDGTVTYSGRSDGTHSASVTVGESCDVEKEYIHAESIYEFETYWERCTWIKMPEKMSLPSIEYRPWREVLDEILEDVSCDLERKNKYRNQLNGVLGYANGFVKQGNFCEESLFSVCMQRLAAKPHLEVVTQHTLFPEFLTSKIRDLISKVVSLSLSLSLCVCVCVCVSLSLCLCVGVSLCLCVYLSLCVCVCVCVGKGVCVWACVRE